LVAERFAPWMADEPSLLRQAVAVVLLNQGKPPDEVLEAMRADSPKARSDYHILYSFNICDFSII
jgi:hypothetical protein